MNERTFNLYMTASDDMKELCEANAKGERNIGTIMSRISGITAQVGVNTYDTAKDIVAMHRASAKAEADPVTSKLADQIKASM